LVSTMLIVLQALLLTAVAIAVGNNMGVIAGPAAGSRILSRNTISALAIVGLSLGYLLEGWKFLGSVSLPRNIIGASFVLAIVILVMLTVSGFVTSITQVFVGIYIGYLLTYGFEATGEILKILGFWCVTFLSSVIVAFLFVKLIASRKTGIISSLLALKLASIVMVFITAYTLGANTIGFIVAFIGQNANDLPTVALTISGIIVGVLVIRGRRGITKLGSGFYGLRYTSSVAPYVSTLILTEVGTQFSIPLPMSISIFSGMLGAALAMRLRFISRRKVATYIMLSWVLPLILSIVLSYITFKILHLGHFL